MSLLRVFPLRLRGDPSSSMRRSHTASRPLSAMQLTNTTLMFFSRRSIRNVANIEFTKAVFPHPGEPEMYKTGSAALASGLELINDVMKSVISCRSGRRPAISAELLQVGRRSARARRCKGTQVDGVRGGVCNPKFVVNICDPRLEVDALRRKAIQRLGLKNVQKEQSTKRHTRTRMRWGHRPSETTRGLVDCQWGYIFLISIAVCQHQCCTRTFGAWA